MSIAYCQGVYLSVNFPPPGTFSFILSQSSEYQQKVTRVTNNGLDCYLCFHDVYFVFMIMTLWDIGKVVSISLWDIVELLLNLQCFQKRTFLVNVTRLRDIGRTLHPQHTASSKGLTDPDSKHWFNYDILLCYNLGREKLSANGPFFIGAQIAVSL